MRMISSVLYYISSITWEIIRLKFPLFFLRPLLLHQYLHIIPCKYSLLYQYSILIIFPMSITSERGRAEFTTAVKRVRERKKLSTYFVVHIIRVKEHLWVYFQVWELWFDEWIHPKTSLVRSLSLSLSHSQTRRGKILNLIFFTMNFHYDRDATHGDGDELKVVWPGGEVN